MIIYWLFLALSLLICMWCENNYQVIKIGNHYEKRAYWIQAIMFFAVVIFFCGLRSGIADTGTYIHMFESYPSNVEEIAWDTVDKDQGFYFLSVLYKQFISTDFHGWLFIIALVSGTATMYALKKYSSTFGMSCYLFITTTMFTYLVNGMRQYICISILFASIGLIIEKKFWRFLVVVLLVSTIHQSALIFILVYFLANIRPWSGKMYIIMALAMIVGLQFDKLLPMFGSMLEETQYAGYVSYISTEGVGSNIIRLVIAAIPCVLAFIGKKVIHEENNEVINLSINMSVINFCLYFIATFSSGMVVGRITTYFDIFNLILLPWLLEHVFEQKSRKIMVFFCIVFYVLYFYYQMVITWNMPYESDILGIFC